MAWGCISWRQDSLGGNCKTCLIVCISPSASDVSETIGALEFGAMGTSASSFNPFKTLFVKTIPK